MDNIKHIISIAVTITLLLCSTGCSNTKVKYDITKESIIESQDINKAIQGLDLSDYTATIDCSNLEPSDEEIESRFEEELASYMKQEEIKDRAIKSDDTIKAKIICEYNGHILNNYHKELSEIHIGSDDLPQSFYNELIGNSSKTQSDKSFFDEDVRIAQLSKGESCDIKLVLYIDGRSMDNSYMNKQGQLEITVNAEQPDLQDTVSNNVITAVKTGDSNNILLYIIVALAGIAGIAGVVVMRQRNRQ